MNPFTPLGDRDSRLYFTREMRSTAASGLQIVVAAAFRPMPVEAVETV